MPETVTRSQEWQKSRKSDLRVVQRRLRSSCGCAGVGVGVDVGDSIILERWEEE
ncbi:MAG: hypothetical protein RL215_2312 [Planctomycetota bacterium]